MRPGWGKTKFSLHHYLLHYQRYICHLPEHLTETRCTILRSSRVCYYPHHY